MENSWKFYLDANRDDLFFAVNVTTILSEEPLPTKVQKEINVEKVLGRSVILLYFERFFSCE